MRVLAVLALTGILLMVPIVFLNVFIRLFEGMFEEDEIIFEEDEGDG